MKREILFKLRKKNNLTQKQLAELAGIKRSYLGLIENGKRNPSLEIAIKLSLILDESVETIFGNDIFLK